MLLVKAAMPILFLMRKEERGKISVTPKTEGSHDCTCTYLLCRRLLSPETKWKAKQDPRLMTALLLFSPGGITTLIVAFLGDFEVPLLLIAELMSFGEFENSFFSSFSTVKCYMLTFYSAHYEFRDTEMTGVLLHILLWFFQLKKCLPKPSHCHAAMRCLLEKRLWEPSSCPTRGSLTASRGSTAFVPAPPDLYLCVWPPCHVLAGSSWGKMAGAAIPVQDLPVNKAWTGSWQLVWGPWGRDVHLLPNLGHNRAKHGHQ